MSSSGLARHLVQEGYLTHEDCLMIARDHSNTGAAFAKVVVALGLMTEDQLAEYLAGKTRYELIQPGAVCTTELNAAGTIDLPLMQRLEVVPLSLTRQTLRVALADPLDLSTIQQLEFFLPYRIKPVIATFTSIYKSLSHLMPDFKPTRTTLEKFLWYQAKHLQHRAPTVKEEAPAPRPKAGTPPQEQILEEESDPSPVIKATEATDAIASVAADDDLGGIWPSEEPSVEPAVDTVSEAPPKAVPDVALWPDEMPAVAAAPAPAAKAPPIDETDDDDLGLDLEDSTVAAADVPAPIAEAADLAADLNAKAPDADMPMAVEPEPSGGELELDLEGGETESAPTTGEMGEDLNLSIDGEDEASDGSLAELEVAEEDDTPVELRSDPIDPLDPDSFEGFTSDPEGIDASSVTLTTELGEPIDEFAESAEATEPNLPTPPPPLPPIARARPELNLNVQTEDSDALTEEAASQDLAGAIVDDPLSSMDPDMELDDEAMLEANEAGDELSMEIEAESADKESSLERAEGMEDDTEPAFDEASFEAATTLQQASTDDTEMSLENSFNDEPLAEESDSDSELALDEASFDEAQSSPPFNTDDTEMNLDDSSLSDESLALAEGSDSDSELALDEASFDEAQSSPPFNTDDTEMNLDDSSLSDESLALAEESDSDSELALDEASFDEAQDKPIDSTTADLVDDDPKQDLTPETAIAQLNYGLMKTNLSFDKEKARKAALDALQQGGLRRGAIYAGESLILSWGDKGAKPPQLPSKLDLPKEGWRSFEGESYDRVCLAATKEKKPAVILASFEQNLGENEAVSALSFRLIERLLNSL